MLSVIELVEMLYRLIRLHLASIKKKQTEHIHD